MFVSFFKGKYFVLGTFLCIHAIDYSSLSQEGSAGVFAKIEKLYPNVLVSHTIGDEISCPVSHIRGVVSAPPIIQQSSR